MLNNNVITARKVTQNNHQFLVGKFSISQILTFTRYTHRLIVGYDEENKPIYNLEIQRKVENSRVEKIADFLINDPDALFPTNIVLSVPDAVIDNLEDTGDGNVKLSLNELVFQEVKKKGGDIHLTIIDGQHRTRGIEKAIERLQAQIHSLQAVLQNSQDQDLNKKLDYYTSRLENLKKIELMVSFFIGPTLEFQAMIFSTINRTQKSVPQSLVYELFGLTANDSPQKSALQISLSLNGYEGSPFYNRIKLHGGSYGANQNPPLTQATIVKSLIDLICTNLRDSENDRFRPRRELLKNINPDLCFRRYYANNNDNFISDILFSYFTSVKEVFVNDQDISFWDFGESTKPTNILQTTVGYQALLDLLVDILKELQEEDKDKIDSYKQYLRKVTGLDFANQQRYPFTSKSRKIFYYDLSLKVWPPTSPNDERQIKLNALLNS